LNGHDHEHISAKIQANIIWTHCSVVATQKQKGKRLETFHHMNLRDKICVEQKTEGKNKRKRKRKVELGSKA